MFNFYISSLIALYLQVCEDVSNPREVCNQMPEEKCTTSPATVTKFQDEEECSYVNTKVCDPVTRQECENIKENVPKQTLEQRCETKYVEECSTSSPPSQEHEHPEHQPSGY